MLAMPWQGPSTAPDRASDELVSSQEQKMGRRGGRTQHPSRPSSQSGALAHLPQNGAGAGLGDRAEPKQGPRAVGRGNGESPSGAGQGQPELGMPQGPTPFTFDLSNIQNFYFLMPYFPVHISLKIMPFHSTNMFQCVGTIFS